MSGETRTIETRIAEAEERFQKALEKAKKEEAQLKQLQARKSEQERKERTHMLIVCGAKIASVYGGHYLSSDEIQTVCDYLKEQKELGRFAIRSTLDSEIFDNEKEDPDSDDWKNPDFNF